jgi:hypothetical protein
VAGPGSPTSTTNSPDTRDPTDDDSGDEEHPAAESSSLAYAVVLIGVVGFVVSCFLPYAHVVGAPGGYSVSLYRLLTLGDATLAAAGGFLLLFAGAATIALISFVALMRPRAWALPALAAASIVWSLTSIGLLLGAYGFYSSMNVGYWLIVVSIAVVVLGTILVGFSVRARHGRQARGTLMRNHTDDRAEPRRLAHLLPRAQVPRRWWVPRLMEGESTRKVERSRSHGLEPWQAQDRR